MLVFVKKGVWNFKDFVTLAKSLVQKRVCDDRDLLSEEVSTYQKAGKKDVNCAVIYDPRAVDKLIKTVDLRFNGPRFNGLENLVKPGT